MLHQLVGIIELVERIRGKTKRFGDQADKAVAELLHVIKVSFQGISETWDKLLVGPLAPNVSSTRIACTEF